MCIRDSVRAVAAGLGDVADEVRVPADHAGQRPVRCLDRLQHAVALLGPLEDCLLYTSVAADERSSVDLGGRRIIKKKT